MYTDALTIFAGMLVLVGASGLFVHAVSSAGRILKLREFSVVFVLLGFATVAPELFIGLNAVHAGIPELAFGNAIGTSIASLSFIGGMIAVFSHSFKTKNFFHHRDLSSLTISVVLLFLLASDGYLSRLDGTVLLIAFAYYLLNLIQYRKAFSLKIKEPKKTLAVHLFIMLVSLLAMHFSSQAIVFAGKDLAVTTGLTPFLIAVALIAPIGAIPELIVELELVRSKLSNLSFGDLFTSVVVNSTLVIGILSAVSPFTVQVTELVQFSVLFMVIILMLFNYFVRSRDELSWQEGLFLVISYFFFITSIFIVSGAA
ncbi:MAG: putative calcium/sodium:proton antiporter [candidate division WS6 bacterium OLB20]|uniref:Putative calcium/sodium:proton antiporter n=1 Tax=candidate division WS6 bacterium OLB20 TaxID=1617426 RepID=A0A136LXQ0_9BACT|nr:MAG: putative calcium/sodium:proton antiporter [candidate division WS6 bacterium OLB20]